MAVVVGADEVGAEGVVEAVAAEVSDRHLSSSYEAFYSRLTCARRQNYMSASLLLASDSRTLQQDLSPDSCASHSAKRASSRGTRRHGVLLRAKGLAEESVQCKSVAVRLISKKALGNEDGNVPRATPVDLTWRKYDYFPPELSQAQS